MFLISRIFINIASIITFGFGFWHFFVPHIWNWYSYIDSKATELIIAVRAINVFFSLSLVLFGVINILFINIRHVNKYSIIIILSATCVLWVTRLVFQIIFPQGSMNPMIQYSMLFSFILVTVLFLSSFLLLIVIPESKYRGF